MKKLLMVAVLATLAFTAIACGPPAGSTTKTGVAADGKSTTKSETTEKK